VYVGIDNLMVRSGRDLRPWIAAASASSTASGSRACARWSCRDAPRLTLFSFNVGVEIGRLAVVVVVARPGRARTRGEWAGRRLA
jgi:hypothetical protein